MAVSYKRLIPVYQNCMVPHARRLLVMCNEVFMAYQSIYLETEENRKMC